MCISTEGCRQLLAISGLPAGTVAVPPSQVTVISVLSVLVILNQWRVSLSVYPSCRPPPPTVRVAIGLHDDVGLRDAVDGQRDGVGTVGEWTRQEPSATVPGVTMYVVPLIVKVTVDVVARVADRQRHDVVEVGAGLDIAERRRQVAVSRCRERLVDSTGEDGDQRRAVAAGRRSRR